MVGGRNSGGLNSPFRPDILVRRPSAEDDRASVLDSGVCSAQSSLAVRTLQPPVLPHGHHADHGQEAGAAAGQDVPRVGRDQHALQGGGGQPSQGWRLH